MDILDCLGISYMMDWFKPSRPKYIHKKPIPKIDWSQFERPIVKKVVSIPKNRPQTFQQYVGQQSIKDLLKNYISGTKSRNKVFPHTLLHGKAGMGKTSLAMLIAKVLDVDYKEVLGETDPETILQTIRDLDGGVLFIDEIHQLKTETAEKLYQVMEDFRIGKESVSEFTLIGATTEMGNLLKRVKPFYDRFKVILDLEPYTKNELLRMIKSYHKRVYPNVPILYPVLKKLTDNCRGTPRTNVRLFEAFVYLKDSNKVLKSFGIIDGGYTEKDLKLLKFLKESNTGVGEQALASYLGTSKENYLYDIEPYLLQNNLLIRTARGRRINEAGLKLIDKLEEIKNARKNG